MALLLLLLLFATVQLLPPASCSSFGSSNYYCDWCPRHSTASLFPPAAAGAGACGYGAAMATEEELNGGPHVAAAGAEFFRDGAGCGACYQLRCRDRRVCGGDGVKVVVVTGAANRTAGFQLGREAFAAMARSGMADQLAALGDNVQVEFRRVPCDYKKKNLTVRVEEGSRNPGQLGIRFLYQGGQTDIAAVEIAGESNDTQPSSWRPMARLRRGLWRTTRPPAGALRLRLVVTAGFGGKWLRARDAVLPADWRPRQEYDTGLRVTDVALRTCSCRSRVVTGGGGEELR
ncbi:unnamed protein product [Urochloa decumbens]|uniref:Expansin-like EG45 domain-containing protein n=1 Tax=Urochloa decumbens TaxID=240449 RepID=A0ABC8ZRL9_9POAL